jgi:hypothetical protein
MLLVFAIVGGVITMFTALQNASDLQKKLIIEQENLLSKNKRV